MRSHRLTSFLFATVLAGGLTAVVLHAQDALPAASQPAGLEAAATQSAATQASSARVSPGARIVLDKMRDAYAGLAGLDVTGTDSIVFDGAGQTKNDHSSFTGSFRSPNQFRHEIKDENTIVSTGEKLYAYLAKSNSFLETDAPKTRTDGVPDQIGSVLMDQNPSLFLAMSPDAGKAVINGASDVSVGDDVLVNGGKFTSLNIVTEDQDIRVLVDQTTAMIRQVQHNLSRSLKAQGVPNVTTALVTVDYTASTAGGGANAAQFAWTPPADAKPMKADAGAAGGNGGPATQLEGKAAPAFTLKGLDGKSVSLGDLKGSVVVFDFWATWCPPCREGLPHVDKVAKDRAADGVKVFAVNLQEESAQVQAFMKQQNLSLPILLDSDAAVAKSYLAEGIPETVVIGKDGVVRKVIVGLVPNEEKILNDEIDAALKGK